MPLEVNFSRAMPLNIICVKGETLGPTTWFFKKKVAGVSQVDDLTGSTLNLEVYNGAGNIYLNFTNGAGLTITPLEGKLVLLVNAVDTIPYVPGVYTYKLYRIYPDTIKRSRVRGTFEIRA